MHRRRGRVRELAAEHHQRPVLLVQVDEVLALRGAVDATGIDYLQLLPVGAEMWRRHQHGDAARQAEACVLAVVDLRDQPGHPEQAVLAALREDDLPLLALLELHLGDHLVSHLVNIKAGGQQVGNGIDRDWLVAQHRPKLAITKPPWSTFGLYDCEPALTREEPDQSKILKEMEEPRTDGVPDGADRNPSNKPNFSPNFKVISDPLGGALLRRRSTVHLRLCGHFKQIRC